MRAPRAQRGGLLLLLGVALLQLAACGGKSVSPGDEGIDDGNPADAAPPLPPSLPCELGQPGVSGMLDGIPIGPPTAIGMSGGTGSDSWTLAWVWSPFGVVFSWGPGPFPSMTNAEAIVATPRSGSFRGGVYEASVALADSGPYPQRAYFSNLRRVGSCPGNPLPGELKYYPGLLVGTLGPTRIDRLSLDGGSLNGDGMLVRFFADGGVLVVEGTGADWAGVVVLPAARSSGEVICLDALKAPPLKGEFHATKLSLAGRRPGTPIGGELLIEPCTE